MLLENNSYQRDIRVQNEAQTLVDAGYIVSVVCPTHEVRRFKAEKVEGVQVYSYPAPPNGDGLVGYVVEYGYSLVIMGFLTLMLLLRDGFDVIHAHNPPDLMILLALPYKIIQKKFIFDHHDLSPELYQYARFEAEHRRVLVRILTFFEVLSCRVADRVIATNESYKAIEVERAKIAPEKVTIVRNGPNLERITCEVTPRTYPQHDKVIIGYLGVIGYQDGVDHLVRALQHLRDDFGRADFHCTIVGSGDALPLIQKLAQEAQLDECITWVGWVDQQDVPSYLQSFDLCVAPEPPNVYSNQSTVIKLMEYMAFSKPTVAYDLPEHRHSAGGAALYAAGSQPIDLARAIVELLDDPERRTQMGRIGIERIRNELAWEHQGRKLLTMYRELTRSVDDAALV
jgi:glycosyltransferase involved in cell wall biosynthesis